MTPPQARILPDGKRLHLNHGPIDLVIDAEGPDRDKAYNQATNRFQTILTELVAELDILRQPYSDQAVNGPVAARMADAVSPFAHTTFVTPMAAVAGAVADEILTTMTRSCNLTKAYVNNGGDTAFFLTQDKTIRAAGPTGPIDINHADPVRGMATSGWRGRSHSLGIADAVTVIAKTAAMADVAATLIANTVDIPDHPGITRIPAHEIETENELGDRLITTDVQNLAPGDIEFALDNGAAFATQCLDRGLITGAALLLGKSTRALP